jgi:hypothetical protein
MNIFKRYLLAVLAGTAVQPLWAMTWMVGPHVFEDEGLLLPEFALGIALIVAIVGGLIVLLVGVPTFQALRVFGKADARWLAAVGFALPGVPFGVVPTIAAMLDPAASMPQIIVEAGNGLVLGLHGMFGALAFLWAWRRSGGERANGMSMPAPPMARLHPLDPV